MNRSSPSASTTTLSRQQDRVHPAAGIGLIRYVRGCEIVIAPHNNSGKAIKTAGMDLGEPSPDTVKMFANDAKAAGFSL